MEFSRWKGTRESYVSYLRAHSINSARELFIDEVLVAQ